MSQNAEYVLTPYTVGKPCWGVTCNRCGWSDLGFIKQDHAEEAIRDHLKAAHIDFSGSAGR